jgi:hypothetical protein
MAGGILDCLLVLLCWMHRSTLFLLLFSCHDGLCLTASVFFYCVLLTLLSRFLFLIFFEWRFFLFNVWDINGIGSAALVALVAIFF